MANKFAVANGNFNATSTWSDTPAGAPGASIPVAGDNAYSNSKTVTITADATCTKISTEPENGATGSGGFILNGGVTLNADIKAGAGATSALTASYSSPLVSTINGNITGGSAVNVNALYASGTGTLNINGSLTAGTNTQSRAMYVANSMTINIVGSILSTTAAQGVTVGNFAAIISITGSITAVFGYGLEYGTNFGSLTITGNIYGGTFSSNGFGLYITGVAPITITGNVYGGTTAGAHAINTTNVTGLNITINGNVYGGDTSVNLGGYGVNFNALFGSTLTVNGAAYAMKYLSGVYNAATGTVKIIRAVGNSYGATQNVGLITSVGLFSAVYNSISYVEQIEYGLLGNTPTYGPILLTDKISNVALLTKSSGIKKTLYDATNISGALPAASDVRYGVTYNYNINSGTCYVPSPSSVAYAVPVDSGVGTAVLTASAIWNSLTSTMTTSGSIGERLKNVSTIASTSQQLADALSA